MPVKLLIFPYTCLFTLVSLLASQVVKSPKGAVLVYQYKHFYLHFTSQIAIVRALKSAYKIGVWYLKSCCMHVNIILILVRITPLLVLSTRIEEPNDKGMS